MATLHYYDSGKNYHSYINIVFTYHSRAIAGFTNITLMQLFSARGDGVSHSQGDIFGCHNLRGVLLASSRERPGMLNILQLKGHLTTLRNYYPMQNVNRAGLETLL